MTNGRPRAGMKPTIPTDVEIPNPKLPNPKGSGEITRVASACLGVWDFEFANSLGFGFWGLGF